MRLVLQEFTNKARQETEKSMKTYTMAEKLSLKTAEQM